MKIVIVNSFDIHGGASIAANRLHRYLLDSNVDSTMIVAYKNSEMPTILGSTNIFQKMFVWGRTYLDSIFIRFYFGRKQQIFSTGLVGSLSIVNKINKLNPDVVHLHWITAGMISVLDLKKIKGKIVWSMHDMWSFTGGCHYNNGCLNYLTECNKCPVLGSGMHFDLSLLAFKLKDKYYPQSINFIGLSKWITSEAKQSKLLSNHKIINLPNPIDCDLFKPAETLKLGTTTRKKKILFGAQDSSEIRKGFHLLNQSIKYLMKDDFEFFVLGSNNFQTNTNGFIYLGSILNENDLVDIYRQVDLVILPSIQENFSNMILESLACGVPVVAFDIGGNGDLIKHKFNGFLVQPFSPQGISEGILWCFENLEYLSFNSRNYVLDNFEKTKIVRSYMAFYRSLLNE